jgi:hypothetical protein
MRLPCERVRAVRDVLDYLAAGAVGSWLARGLGIAARWSEILLRREYLFVPEAVQFCIGLENKPGVLAKLCSAIRRAGVKIDALFVSDDEDFCWVNMVASPADGARDMLTTEGYNFFTETVLVVCVKHPGELETIASRLAGAGVNINNVYGSCADGSPSTLVLNVSDLSKAAEIVETTTPV